MFGFFQTECWPSGARSSSAAARNYWRLTTMITQLPTRKYLNNLEYSKNKPPSRELDVDRVGMRIERVTWTRNTWGKKVSKESWIVRAAIRSVRLTPSDRESPREEEGGPKVAGPSGAPSRRRPVPVQVQSRPASLPLWPRAASVRVSFRELVLGRRGCKRTRYSG